MVSCKTATQYIVQESDSKSSLNWREKLSWRFHILFCKACKLFKRQNDLIDSTLNSKSIKNAPPRMSDSKKQELESLINNNL